ncbi:hypothetical protein [Streptomyces sp. NPDC093676]|uniref:hypothetical protein n=1 Tax=Streptomyces sp. NPDC093676 TaxID=3366050 RepID=UPI0038221481
MVRLHILNPRYAGGSVDQRDVHAPWVTHLAQQYLLRLAATGASSARLMTVGYAARWFAMFLRTLPGEGRRPGDVGRDGVLAYLRWLTHRARDTSDFQLLNEDDPVRQIVAERLLPSRRGGGAFAGHTATALRASEVPARDPRTRPAWLADNHAADVHLLEMDVPLFPERDDTASELEGRSQDALPEQVFLSSWTSAISPCCRPGTAATASSWPCAWGGGLGRFATWSSSACSGTRVIGAAYGTSSL